MKCQKKRGNENRHPQNSIPSTGESFGTIQRYSIYSLNPLFIVGNFICVDVFKDNQKACEMAIPYQIWNDEKELKELMNEYNISENGK
jgi:hypothetical protein